MLLVSIVVAAFLDTLIFTGFFTYGGAVAAAATLAYSQNVPLLSIFVSSVAGIFVAEIVNVFLAINSDTKHRVNTAIAALEIRNGFGARMALSVLHRPTDSVFHSMVKLLALRFFALTRPINTVLFALTKPIKGLEILLILLCACIWSGFWLILFDGVLKKLGGV